VPVPGERIGPFDLVEVLAVRPHANLWRAVRAEGQGRGPREVVLRVVHDAQDGQSLAELRREYDALRAIDDSRVRKAWGFYAGFGALALEYIDGVSLGWVVQQAAAGAVPLDVATSIDLLVEVANALRVAHDAGVVHGRLCVDTVRLRRDGNVVITDFALPIDRMPVVPPEVAAGLSPTAATDQWLLGALLVHLLTREALLGGEPGNPADGRRDAGAWTSRVDKLSPRLGRTAAKLLQRDPRERYGSESLLIKDLLAALRETADAPRRDLVARKAHLRRPQGELAPVVRAPRTAARPVTEDTRTAPMEDPAFAPPPRAAPATSPRAAEAPAPPVDDPDATSVDLRLPTPAPWNPRAYSFQSTHEMVDAVVDDDDAVTTPRGSPPPPAADEPPEVDEEPPPPPGDRVVPDWAAAFALVLLLAVGVWAILTRIF
jgi:hypothetical protein